MCDLLIAGRRFLRARKWNPSEALNQYREARTFSTEKDVPRLYDSISVDDYEDTRRLVSEGPKLSLTSVPLIGNKKLIRRVITGEMCSTPIGPAVATNAASRL